MNILRKWLQATVAVGAAALLGACSETPITSPTGNTSAPPSFHIIPPEAPELELLALCKVGPAGTYTFNATATNPVLWNTATQAFDASSATYSVTVDATTTVNIGGVDVQGNCVTFTGDLFSGFVHDHIARAGGGLESTVTIVETGIPAGIAFDHGVTYQRLNDVTSSSSTTTNSVSGILGGDPTADHGANIVFYNKVVPTTVSGTATGAGFPWKATQGAPNNWFMYTPWVTTGGYQGISPNGTDLIAGKTNVAGRITGTRGTTTSITITLNSGYTFVDGVGNVAINPMSCTTSQPYVTPGQFSVKATVSSASNTVTVSGLPNTACYGIHTNVSWTP